MTVTGHNDIILQGVIIIVLHARVYELYNISLSVFPLAASWLNTPL